MSKIDLAGRPVKAICANWGLGQIKGRAQDAPGAVGQAVRFGEGGQTTEIVSYDPITQRILTRSGSVYQLGVPNLGYAVGHPDILKELGF